MKNILEIACFNYESAIIAANAGADRIEFCSEFSTGGLTPDLKETEKLIKKIDIPVFVMIRKRGGNFIYTEDEIQDSKLKIQNFKDIGVSGFVFGILQSSMNPSFDTSSKNRTTQDDHLQRSATASVTLSRSESSSFVSKGNNQQLVKLAYPLPCTFHRAFDHTENIFESLEDIIDCGFTRILCSGGQGNAIDNIETLKKLNEAAKDRITIMPGGGVRSTNIEKLLETGCTEFHSSGILSGEVANENEVAILKSLIQK
jgi:copper homeostasis protein